MAFFHVHPRLARQRRSGNSGHRPPRAGDNVRRDRRLNREVEPGSRSSESSGKPISIRQPERIHRVLAACRMRSESFPAANLSWNADFNFVARMVSLLSNRNTAHAGREETRNESFDQFRLEVEDLEGHPRSGPHRVRFDGRLRSGCRGRCHAVGRHQHQHGLQQSRRA